ncbi:Poly ADP-ribose polymerase [Hondaea fermentalgiana]|uniref:Poly [ADP-ribose] polymerase n=1 Tax=Hondaea fermentalgiana TaxID=2315210 RepID=A0A2R5GRU7_9STRA|nr:Poly ADP-ribose polymerase [Hondaea fermentalgiana]|eukprot:GBG30604.1 Poly ADP-ribose polymerase [Hondaea fermentalgiana]
MVVATRATRSSARLAKQEQEKENAKNTTPVNRSGVKRKAKAEPVAPGKKIKKEPAKTTRVRSTRTTTSARVAAPVAVASKKKNAANVKVKKQPQPQPQPQPTTQIHVKTGLKGVASPTPMNIGTLDSGFLAKGDAITKSKAGKVAELKRDGRLVLVDPSKNSDKYYIIQLIKSGATWYCWQRWGRTGTSGQGMLHKGTKAKMEAEFESKFAEKTGVQYDDANDGSASPLPGKYEWLSVVPAAQAKTLDAKWEYYVDDHVDGKPTGWYPYVADASQVVEQLYRDHHVAKNSNMAVRFVESGSWTYRVDLSSTKGDFRQTNTRTSKERKIRRNVLGSTMTSGPDPASTPATTGFAAVATATASALAAAASSAISTVVSPLAKAAPKAVAQASQDIPVRPRFAAMVPQGSKVFDGMDCMLNQTNIRANNNKFYCLQVVEAPNGMYYALNHWGRVGENGQASKKGSYDPEIARKFFEQKFKDKTGNNWADRDNFVKKNKYDLILTKNVSGEFPKLVPAASAAARGPVPKSALDTATADFVKFIFDKDMFKEQMAGLDIDVDKLPLGALSDAQVQSAYDVLSDIERELNGSARRNVLTDLSSRYYTVVPHAFGRQVPPVISNEAMLQKEFELINVIGDIEKAQSMIKTSDVKQATLQVNPLDAHFASLNMKDWEVVGPQTDTFKRINAYASRSKGRNMKLQRLFQVGRDGEDAHFKKYDGLDRMLLWHGTNVAVVAAILKSGLRIMPHSGGRVGAGIYLASEHSKSSGYTCGARWNGKNLGIMFLVEAVVGKSKEIQRDDPRLRKPPSGFHSVLAKGRKSPMGSGDEVIKIEGRNVTIPAGPVKDTGVSSSFYQDEILIYDERQHRLRFVLVFEM